MIPNARRPPNCALATHEARGYPIDMADFVLVHGGAHAGWCWDRLIPFLKADPRVGTVLAVDLPGHGTREGSIPEDEIGIEDYVAAVVGDIEAADLRDIVLVGHSMAGVTIPHVGHRLPERLQRLVYLTTTNPAIGQCINDSMAHPLSPISRGVDVTEAFCSDLNAETSEWLLSHLGPQPPGPLTERISVVAGPDEIPASYILCEKDEVLPAALQAEEAKRLAVDEVLRFDSGHSPFASQPEALAKLLLGMIR